MLRGGVTNEREAERTLGKRCKAGATSLGPVEGTHANEIRRLWARASWGRGRRARATGGQRRVQTATRQTDGSGGALDTAAVQESCRATFHDLSIPPCAVSRARRKIGRQGSSDDVRPPSLPPKQIHHGRSAESLEAPGAITSQRPESRDGAESFAATPSPNSGAPFAPSPPGRLRRLLFLCVDTLEPLSTAPLTGVRRCRGCTIFISSRRLSRSRWWRKESVAR